jgi:hypothetical protein
LGQNTVCGFIGSHLVDLSDQTSVPVNPILFKFWPHHGLVGSYRGLRMTKQVTFASMIFSPTDC